MQESIQLVIDSLPFLLKGAGYTLQLSIGGMFFGLLLGFILALMRLSPIWPVRWLARRHPRRLWQNRATHGLPRRHTNTGSGFPLTFINRRNGGAQRFGSIGGSV